MRPLLPGLPFVAHGKQRSETTKFLVQAANLGGYFVRVAHDPEIVEAVFGGDRGIRHLGIDLGQIEHVVLGEELLKVLSKVAGERSVQDFAARAVGRVGDVDVAGDPPFAPVWTSTDVGGPLLDRLPVALEYPGRDDVDAHRNPVALASQN